MTMFVTLCQNPFLKHEVPRRSGRREAGYKATLLTAPVFDSVNGSLQGSVSRIERRRGIATLRTAAAPHKVGPSTTSPKITDTEEKQLRKYLPYLGASLSTLALVWSAPSNAQTPFADVKPTHWAYQAVTELQQKNIIKGYPNGYFQGQRTLSRYEFAVALQRALANLPAGGGTKGEKGDTGPAGTTGATGDAGPQGPPGPPGMTPEEVAKLMSLTDMFQRELASLGMDVGQIKARLDALGKRVDAIEGRLDRMIKFNGDAFFLYRNDQSTNGFADYSGAFRAKNNRVLQDDNTVHDFHLEMTGNLAGGVKFHGDFVSSNYLSYRGNTLSGGPFATSNAPLTQRNTLYEANVAIPIGYFGNNTQLIVGRYRHQVTPLTMYRPDYDAYSDVPWYDDGNYVQDGVKLTSKFGSVSSSLWTGSSTSVVLDAAGELFNSPLVGSFAGSNPFGAFGKPIGLVNLGQIPSSQNSGVHLGLPLAKFGELGLTMIDFASNNGQKSFTGVASPFNNVVVYGANLKVNPIGRLTVNAEASKSVTQVSFDRGDGQSNEDNNAYTLNVGYNSGAVHAQAGYQYIDPRFQAPGYWNKIGNWYNPTNVRGPFVRLGYNFTDKLQGHLGADYLEGARNRPAIAGSGATGLTIGDNIYRVTGGVKFHLSKVVTLSGDYEGVMYDLGPKTSLSGFRSRPTEQYITVGAGLNLTGNTVLKLAYQLISSDNQGFGFNSGFDGGHSNANVFTGSLGVHF